MSKIKSKKWSDRIHWSHFLAIIVLFSYFTLSKINLAMTIHDPNIVIVFIKIYSFGAVFACFFLYVFSHDKFFPFAKEIEKKEEAKEKKYLQKYIHHGKVLATFIIGTFGGPVFSSLTARLLINNMQFGKYLIVILANIPSTVFTVGIANGFIKLISLQGY